MPDNQESKDIMELHCDRCNVWGSHYYSWEQDKYICKVCYPADNQESPSKELYAQKDENLDDKPPFHGCTFSNNPKNSWTLESGGLSVDTHKDGDLNDKLLPCPFCGSEAESDVDTDDELYRYENVSCPNAHCCGTQIFVTPKEWNTRAPSQQLTATQQALDDAVEALKECAEDLKAELDARYYINDGELHPAMKDRYERDMGAVYRAEAALASISPFTKILEEDTKDQQKRNDFYKSEAGELLDMMKKTSINKDTKEKIPEIHGDLYIHKDFKSGHYFNKDGEKVSVSLSPHNIKISIKE